MADPVTLFHVSDVHFGVEDHAAHRWFADAVARERHRGALGKHVVAAGDADELRDPFDAADQRIVPLLEVDARPAFPMRAARGDVVEMRAQALRVIARGVVRADQRAEPHDVVEDAVDAAMVRNPHLDAGLDQLARDVSLDVGKTDDEIGFQREDVVDLRARERGDFRFFLARARRPYDKSGNADDARVLAERVEHFGRFLGEADDAARADAA